LAEVPGGPSRKRQLNLASEVGRLRRENDRLRMGRDIKSRAYVWIGPPMKPHTCIDNFHSLPCYQTEPTKFNAHPTDGYTSGGQGMTAHMGMFEIKGQV
jgi:hypothetical protein